MGGKPRHIPTDEQREIVEKMAGVGVPSLQIAAFIGIDQDTMLKWYKHEMQLGKAKANNAVGHTLFEKVMQGDTAAAIFWAKTQMRWSEPQPTHDEVPEPKQIIFTVRDARVKPDSE